MSIPGTQWWYLDIRREKYNEEQRPFPPGFMGWVSVRDFRPQDYDVAVLHLDNWCDRPNMALRALPYRILDSRVEGMLPKVVINHGAPDDDVNAENIRRMLGKDKLLVCNSHKAREQWGYEPSRTIVHGYDVDEFGPPTHERREFVTVCSGGELSRQYHGIPLYERLAREYPITWLGYDVKPATYADYREYLRGALVYINPTQWSPMPGARTEAMLSGLCVVTTSHQDEETFIEHGVTGYLCNTFLEFRDVMDELWRHPAKAMKVGLAGREMARERFNKERYDMQWSLLLEEVIGHGLNG